ncbi:MAG: hypothetical protein ACLR8Y_08930 [Alistipes indistinctus]
MDQETCRPTPTALSSSKTQDNKFLEWYRELISQYNLPHYMTVENPDRFFLQTRWNGGDGNTFFFWPTCTCTTPTRARSPSRRRLRRAVTRGFGIPIPASVTASRSPTAGFELELGPAETLFIVFDKVSKGEPWKPLPVSALNALTLKNWQVELHHAREGWVKTTQMETPTDLKETEWKDFAGTVVYRTKFDVNSSNARDTVLNLGKVYGISQVLVNGVDCGREMVRQPHLRHRRPAAHRQQRNPGARGHRPGQLHAYAHRQRHCPEVQPPAGKSGRPCRWASSDR